MRAIIGWPPPRDDQAMAQALPTAFSQESAGHEVPAGDQVGRSARQWQVVGPLPWGFESRYVYVTYITRNYVHYVTLRARGALYA